jgi:hypothetical protein
MTAPVRAPKKPKNQPRPFEETLAPSLPIPTATTQAFRLRISDRQLRNGLIITWIMVMVLVGAVVGLRLLSSQPDTFLPGVPVAAAPVNVAPLPPALPIVKAPAAQYEQPRVVTPVSAKQAQAGNPFKVIAGVAYQPTAGPDALQPGYQTGLKLQGNQGTDSTR